MMEIWERIQSRHLFKEIIDNIEYVEADEIDDDLQNEIDCAIIGESRELQTAVSSGRLGVSEP